MTIGYAAALRNAQLDAITTRAGNGAIFLNRRRRRYFNPSRNPVTGP